MDTVLDCYLERHSVFMVRLGWIITTAMTYELAKNLKDAGFPIRLVIGAVDWRGESIFFDGAHTLDGDKIGFIIPTLSELIEACKEGFAGLGRNKFENGAVKWVASQNIDKSGNWLGSYGHGSTPEEAVANLWLSLHASHHESGDSWDSSEGKTHYENDGCGEPAHNKLDASPDRQ